MAKCLLFTVVAALIASTVGGLEVARAETLSRDIGEALFQQNGIETPLTRIHEREEYNWQFLGCVHSADHCSDKAHGRGYDRHRIVHDHENCDDHHPHLACYGR